MPEPARLQLVRPFKNPSCPYCTGREQLPPREQYRAGNAHMTEAWTDEWNLRGSRHPGWFLHLVLHGLREETQTLHALFRLEGAEQGGGCPAPAYLVEPKRGDRFRTLFGSCKGAGSFGEVDPIIHVGWHLVMELDINGRLTKGSTVLPVAHIIHWFDNPGVG